jgi:heme exporter protein D
MANMNAWDVAVLVAAAYVATTALVRLMIRRRDRMLEEFREQLEAEKRKQAKQREEAELARWEKRAA